MFHNLKIYFKRKTVLNFYTSRVFFNWFHPHVLLLTSLELLHLIALISLQNLRKSHTNRSFLKAQLRHHTQPLGPTGESGLSVHMSFQNTKLTFLRNYFSLLYIVIPKVHRTKSLVFFIFVLPQFLTRHLERFIGSFVFSFEFLF